MSKTIQIRKGLDIKLKGKADLNVSSAAASATFGIKPSDFPGLTPKLTVKTDDIVKAGTSLFYDKKHPEIQFASPVSGKVVAINRAERRRIIEVVVESDGKFESENFPIPEIKASERDAIKHVLLQSGLWPFIIQRPFGVVANPNNVPRDIFISGFDTSPLAPDMDFILSKEMDSLQKGINVLSALTTGTVYLGVREGSAMASLSGVETTVFKGPHPCRQRWHTNPP
jgi:Na+-transporting NADH:ubiquinone oxidoreductase subunit A